MPPTVCSNAGVYISKLPSGGRGEYEIAENLDDLSPTDLIDLPISFRIPEFGTRPAHVALRHVKTQGKNRLRITSGGNIHLVRQIAAAAMLPKPIRDESHLPGGQPTIMEGRFICRRAYITKVLMKGDGLEIDIGTLHLDNGSQVEDVDFNSRMKRIRRVHQDSGGLTSRIATSLDEHKAAISGPEQIASPAERSVKAVMQAVAEVAEDYNVEYTEGADVLETLEEILRLPKYEKPVSIEEIPPSEFKLRRREISKWQRWSAFRGADSAKFRRAVRDAYDSRCIVSGIRFPKNEYCRVPGVDSAHILPWAQYDLDKVCNGLCLSKHFHWAFDQGLIAIRYNGDIPGYIVEVTDLANDAFSNEPAALAQLKAVEGRIPPDRLPKSQDDWPRPEYLEMLYEKLNEV